MNSNELMFQEGWFLGVCTAEIEQDEEDKAGSLVGVGISLADFRWNEVLMENFRSAASRKAFVEIHEQELLNSSSSI